jgi:phosphoglycolate phosphatase
LKLNVDAVVFDLDGTLINLGGFVDWKNAQEEVLKTYVEQGCDEEAVSACRAKGLWSMIEEMYVLNASHYGELKATEIQEEVYRTLSRYEEEGIQLCAKMPGCSEVLEWLRDRGIPMGVCTRNSQTTAEKVLREKSLAHYFEAVVGCTTSHRTKPHPDQLLECYRVLDVEPTRCVIVGDSHHDVIMGKSARSITIAVPMYFSNLEKMKDAGVDRIINSLADLPQALMDL